MTKACSFIKSYSLKPWTLHQKCPVLIQLEQKAPHFWPSTGHFACKKYQFSRFQLKSRIPCAILGSSVGWCTCSLMWKYSTIATLCCQALFLRLLPEISGFFHTPKSPFCISFPTHIPSAIHSSDLHFPLFLSCFTVDFLSKFQFNQNKASITPKLY